MYNTQPEKNGYYTFTQLR